MKVAVPVGLMAFVVGVAVGVLTTREKQHDGGPEAAADGAEGAPKTDAGLEARAVTAEKAAAERDTELAKAKARIRELEAKAEKGSGKAAKKKPETPEEIAAYVEELKARIPELVAKKDGKALIKLMHELASLGEPGYMAAIEISGIIAEDVEGGKKELGLSQNEFYMAFGGPMVPVLVWGLQQGDKVPAGFRAGAAYSLPWQRDVDAGKLFLEALKTEKDPDVIRAISENLAGVIRPEMAADVAAAARANVDNPAMLASLVGSLGGIKSDEAVQYLEAFARDENPALRSEAELALIAVRPPAAGLLITYAAPNSQAEVAGIKRGDIIVSYNGASIRNLDDLRAEIGKTSGDDLVTVLVHRNGEVVPLQIKGQKIGINGKGVAPK